MSQGAAVLLQPALFWDADSTHAKARIAPGPNNPVGLVWIALSREHYGVHGTPEPANVGKTQSHGCIRLTNWDALQLGVACREGHARGAPPEPGGELRPDRPAGSVKSRPRPLPASAWASRSAWGVMICAPAAAPGAQARSPGLAAVSAPPRRDRKAARSGASAARVAALRRGSGAGRRRGRAHRGRRHRRRRRAPARPLSLACPLPGSRRAASPRHASAIPRSGGAHEALDIPAARHARRRSGRRRRGQAVHERARRDHRLPVRLQLERTATTTRTSTATRRACARAPCCAAATSSATWAPPATPRLRRRTCTSRSFASARRRDGGRGRR